MSIRSALDYHRMSQAEWDEWMAAQNGCCAICGDPPDGERLFIDHDHRTGKVRGLLCRRCNCGIGYFRDRPDALLAALVYLERYNT